MRVASFFSQPLEKFTFRFVSMIPFITFARRGAPRSISAARQLSAEIIGAAKAHPSACNLQPQIAALEAASVAGKTLTAITDAIGATLLAAGVARADLAAAWLPRCMPPPAMTATLSARDAGSPDELEAFLVVRPGTTTSADASRARVAAGIQARVSAHLRADGGAAALASLAAASSPAAAPSSVAPSEATFGERAVAEHAAARQRIDAENAARFSKNWGAERDARRLAVMSTYLSMPAGPERVDFLEANKADIFRGHNTILKMPASGK